MYIGISDIEDRYQMYRSWIACFLIGYGLFYLVRDILDLIFG